MVGEGGVGEGGGGGEVLGLSGVFIQKAQRSFNSNHVSNMLAIRKYAA